MKKIILNSTTNEASDQEQLAYTLQEIQENGYIHIFRPGPLAWEANLQFHYDVTIVGEYSWQNSKKKEVVIFILSGFHCKGYHICEFEFDPALSR